MKRTGKTQRREGNGESPWRAHSWLALFFLLAVVNGKARAVIWREEVVTDYNFGFY